ncbi:MAG: thiamine pyrophosphate-binding protein [Acidimicrobiales bacterium]
MSAERNTAEAIAANVAAAGARHMFAYPGDPTIELMEQARRLDIEVVLARREGTAAFMAEAQAMATGRLGVCVSTLGPGSTALLNGVAAANLDRVPLLAISGQIETARQAFFTHQVVDHGRLYAPVTKWAGQVEANAVGPIMRKALRTATAERPGAVHLTCASDTFKARARPDDGPMPPLGGPQASAIDVTAGDDGTERDPRRVLAAARRPILLVGIAATRCAAGAAIERLAEAVGMPIVVAPMAKGVVPETSPWFAGVLDMACNATVWELLAGADLIVAAGFDPVELIKPWRLPVPVLHIDTTPNTDQVYASAVEVVGDVAAAATWLAEDFHGQPRWSDGEVASFRRLLLDDFYGGRVDGKLNPTDVIDEVRRACPPSTIATTDVGSHKLLVGQGWATYEPRTTLMTNGLSAMGFGIPAAIAAKLTCPDRPVVALVGDGGFAMTATELRLAAASRLGIVVVVFVDGSLNRIELKQKAVGYPSTATRIEDMDLVGLAGAMSCDGVRVETGTELEKALATVEGLTCPLVVEARIDPAQYQAQF